MRTLVSLFTCLFVVILPSPAWATCSTTAYTSFTSLPGPVKDRFALLRSSDPIKNREARFDLWQTLIDDAKKEKTPDYRLIALAQTSLAFEITDTGQEARALALAEAAERTASEQGLAAAPWYSEILSNLAVAQLNSGKADLAMASAEQAKRAALKHDGPDSLEAVLANDALGRAYYGRGQYTEAEPYWREAVRVAPKCLAENSFLILSMMNSHAAAMTMKGDFEKGIAGATKAVNWGMAHLEEGNPELILALQNLATDFSFTRQLSEAEPLFRKVVDMRARYTPSNLDSRANSLNNFAEVLDLQGKYEEADAAWQEARSLFLKSTNRAIPHVPLLPLQFMANAAERRGNHQLALERYRIAVAEAKKLLPPDSSFLAETQLQQALVMQTVGDTHAAFETASPAMTILRAKMPANHPRRLVAEIQFSAIVAADQGAEAGHKIAAPVAKTLEDRLLGTATARGDLISSAPLFQNSFSTATVLALASNQFDQAFRTLQLGNLSNMVIANSTTATRAVLQDPLAKGVFQTLQDQIAKRQLLARAYFQAVADKHPEEVARIAAETKANETAIAASAADLDRIFPAYRQVLNPAPISLEAFRASLKPDQILLAPLSAQNGTTIIAVTRDGLTWASSPVSTPRIKELVARVRASIAAVETDASAKPSFDTEAAAALFDAILPQKLRPIFAAHPDLLYYASGPLASLPPSLLLTKHGKYRNLSSAPWLIRSHSITILPTLAERPVRGINDSRIGKFLGVGAPLKAAAPDQFASRGSASSGGRNAITALPSLPQAQAELQKMGAVLGGPDNKMLLGADMTETALRGLPLDQFSIIAFATHGLVGEDLAGVNEPALVMTPVAGQEGDLNGLLTASKIVGLHLDADWVILSACNTASGNGAGMPAYGGLATAFMQAGARALLVSHWPVRDDAAERLTVATLANSRNGISRAKALQRATVKLLMDRKIANAANPAVWGPFVLIDR